MMFFLPVMLLLLSGGSAKVVQDFQSECGQFFAYGITPTVFHAPQFRQICQKRNNLPYFATLYDTYHKIPVYSAYRFAGSVDCERDSSWYIEPQIENRNEDQNMVLQDFTSNYQASNSDYKTSGYDKGHLAPVSLANSQGCADATFTLTNAAPQNPSFNRGQWRVVESSLNNVLSSSCSITYTPAYIVTGVVPGNYKIKNRVNVPSYFWTAYCCQTSNNQLISGGIIGINQNELPVPMNVKCLEMTLTVLYNVAFTLFHDNCRNALYVELLK